jgi:hypothetical protein
MATAKHYKLSSVSGNCQQVLKRGKATGWQYPNPIGKVCKVSGGYEYYVAPVLDQRRGPVKTKMGAVRAVIKRNAIWVGQSAFAGPQRRRKRR